MIKIVIFQHVKTLRTLYVHFTPNCKMRLRSDMKLLMNYSVTGTRSVIHNCCALKPTISNVIHYNFNGKISQIFVGTL